MNTHTTRRGFLAAIIALAGLLPAFASKRTESKSFETPEKVQGWPPDAQLFLDELYAHHNLMTAEEKFRFVDAFLGGSSSFSHNPSVEMKLVCVEYELLAQYGLIGLDLC